MTDPGGVDEEDTHASLVAQLMCFANQLCGEDEELAVSGLIDAAALAALLGEVPIDEAVTRLRESAEVLAFEFDLKGSGARPQ